jgi:transforming growth factor-beta-induced protein
MSADVSTGFVNTVAIYNGQAGEHLSAFINTSMGVRLNDAASVIMPDISADNGVIHEIDAVILPMNVAQIASMSDDFSTLMAAVGAADAAVATRLTSTSDVTTVFAPTNAAFADLLTRAGVADLGALLAAVGQTGLTQVLLYHTVDGNVRSTDLSDGNVPTLQGTDVMVSVSDPSITDANMDKAMIIATDVQGTNGVVHVIDFVIQP